MRLVAEGKPDFSEEYALNRQASALSPGAAAGGGQVLDPKVFYVTGHYRNYPTLLVRLAEVRRSLLAEVLEEARLHMGSS
jgi:hypothetical protein